MMWKSKKLMMFICILSFVFLLPMTSYAKFSGLSEVEKFIEIIERRLEDLKTLDDDLYAHKSQLQSSMIKDRDFLAYSYGKGSISLDKYNLYIQRYKLEYALFGLNFEAVEDIKVDNSFSESETLNYHVIDIIARDTMQQMYDTMPNDVKLKKLTTLDPWYLCPYGCYKIKMVNGRESKSKVLGWNEKCTHHSNFNSKSLVTISTNKLNLNNVQSKQITIRRDCSAYITMLLANLGCDYMWKLNNYELGTSNLLDMLKYNNYTLKGFEIYEYKKEILKPGDIVLKNGHTELFMGWDNIENNTVYHYSWGSTADVENILKDEKVDYKNAVKQDDRYSGGKSGYKYIIRYVGSKE